MLLCVCVYVCMCVCVYVCLAVWLSGCLAFWLSGCLAVWLSGCLAVWLSGCLAVWLSGCLAVWLSGCLAVWLSGCLAVWLLLPIVFMHFPFVSVLLTIVPLSSAKRMFDRRGGDVVPRRRQRRQGEACLRGPATIAPLLAGDKRVHRLL